MHDDGRGSGVALVGTAESGRDGSAHIEYDSLDVREIHYVRYLRNGVDGVCIRVLECPNKLPSDLQIAGGKFWRVEKHSADHLGSVRSKYALLLCARC